MTFWEFAACVAGWNRGQGGGHHHNGDPMTDDEYEDLCERVERWING